MRITVAATAAGLAAVLLAAGCQKDNKTDPVADKSSDTGSTKTAAKQHTVVMEVTGTKKTADIDYIGHTMTSSGDLKVSVPDTKAGGAAVPWSRTIQLASSSTLTLSVNPPIDLDDNTATVSCRVTVDGKEAAKDENETAVASCMAEID